MKTPEKKTENQLKSPKRGFSKIVSDLVASPGQTANVDGAATLSTTDVILHTNEEPQHVSGIELFVNTDEADFESDQEDLDYDETGLDSEFVDSEEVQEVAGIDNDMISEAESNTVMFKSPRKTTEGLETELRSNPEVQKIIEKMVQEKLAKVGSASKLIKSPSYTTIYVPALKRKINGMEEMQSIPQQEDAINKISSFVQEMRIKTPIVPVADSKANDTGISAVIPGNVDNVNNFVQNEIVGEPQDPLQQARDFSGHRIIEAEKFKATISAPPTGNVMVPLNKSFGEDHNNFIAPSLALAAWKLDADDSFFHITCHIDPNLREKIEKGEFIKLDKLLPKDKFSKNYEDQKVELVNREGSTFFVAVGRYDKINGIKKWEQAFRIYAAIYSKIS